MIEHYTKYSRLKSICLSCRTWLWTALLKVNLWRDLYYILSTLRQDRWWDRWKKKAHTCGTVEVADLCYSPLMSPPAQKALPPAPLMIIMPVSLSSSHFWKKKKKLKRITHKIIFIHLCIKTGAWTKQTVGLKISQTFHFRSKNVLV